MKSFFVTGLALAIGLSAPIQAQALDFGNGFSLSGKIELEHVHFGGEGTNELTYLFADLGLGWRHPTDGAFGLGVDVNLVGNDATGSIDDRHTFWGGLVLTTPLGEVTVGKPRPLIKTLIQSPAMGGSEAFQSSFDFTGGSRLEGLGMAQVTTVRGVSLTGTRGKLTYGASYSRITTDSPVDIERNVVELVAVLNLGKARFQAGFEQLRQAEFTFDRSILGVTYLEDRWSAGVLAVESPSTFLTTNSLKLFADFKVTDALTLGVQFLQNEISGASFSTRIDTYGVSGEYAFGNGGFAQLGMLSTKGSNVEHVSASVGYRF